MTPGQLVYDTRLGLVVEITRQASEDLYWVRPLGRAHISRFFHARSAWLQEIDFDAASTWDQISTICGYERPRTNIK